MLSRALLVLFALQPSLGCSGGTRSSTNSDVAVVSDDTSADQTGASTVPSGTVAKAQETQSEGGAPAARVPAAASNDGGSSEEGEGGASAVSSSEIEPTAGSGGSADVSVIEELGGAAGTDVEATCLGIADGSYCDAVGNQNIAYACSGGSVVSFDYCSGKCSFGSCAKGVGTTGGASTGAGGCRTCLDANCSNEEGACGGESECTPLLNCAAACTTSECVDACEASWGQNAAFTAFRQCKETKCAGPCAYIEPIP